jgi:hypothetical protein
VPVYLLLGKSLVYFEMITDTTEMAEDAKNGLQELKVKRCRQMTNESEDM